ncbi:hypothetical protein [Actinomadura sp. NPDC000600]|uniref:hypothetical protein n=1 Tax=Actinomadura sp. NPDC000600 TaxID=3154262 RepID=UPI003392851B
MNTALIFVCSSAVDAYLNALCYLSDKRSVTQFSFVFITGAMTEGPSTDFVDDIIFSLERLAEGKYRNRDIEIRQKVKDRYLEIAMTLRSSSNLIELVSLEELDEFLADRAQRASPRQVFIDVTGLPKILTAHVMLISLVSGYQVYAFELRHKVDQAYPERSLYWAMPQGGFDYPPLTRDPAVQSSFRQLIHVRRIVWTIAATSLVGFACFVVLLLVDSTNATLAIIGLAANVIGIASGIFQALMTKAPQ